METNKPFKTISLEQRLAQSVMAKFDPEKTKQAPSKSAADLKLIGNAQEKNAAILKQMARTTKQPVFPTPSQFKQTDLANRDVREAYTSLPKNIRLGDRLSQPLDSKTTHLAKYFLSDTYSGILKATPFVTSPLASRVNIDPYGFADKGAITFHRDLDPKKGSPLLQNTLTPTNPVTTQSTQIVVKSPKGFGSVLTSQGATTSNGAFVSLTEVKRSLSENLTLINQGATISNNVFQSVTQTKLSVIPQLIQQGSVEVKKPIGPTDVALLQGLLLDQGEVGDSFLKPDSLDPIPNIIKGVRRFPKNPATFKLPDLKAKQNTSPAVNDSGQPLQPTTAYKRLAPILQNIDSSLDVLKKDLIGYSAATLPFGYTPSPYYTPTLKVAKYEADRLLARFAPTIKHGSTALKTFNPDIRQGSTEIDQSALNPTPQKGPYKNFKNTGSPIGFLDALRQANSQPTPEVFQEGATVGYGNVNREIWASIRQALENGDALPTDDFTNFPSGETSQGSLSRYKALSYGEIESLGAAAANNAGKSSEAASGPNPQIGAGNRTVQNVPDYNGKDYITIKIASETLGTSVVFKAYLTAFSDSFSTSWNDVQYVGRQETLKQFKGVTRGVSFGLSVPSFSGVDLPINMAKIQRAINITSIASYSGNYLKGPLCKLTLGGFFKNVYVVFNSFKVDFDPAESTWDIDKGLPHLLKISMDATVLGDAANNGLDAKTSIHYNT